MSLSVPASFMPGLPPAFRYGMAFIWQPEQDGHQDDRAPGEGFRTSWGVVQDTWDEAVRDGIVAGDLADATQAQCGNIYLAKYFNVMRLAMLPPAVSFMLFCDGTLTGAGHVVSMLQRLVGNVGVDGVLGDKTLAATNLYLSALGPANLVNELADADEAYLADLANAPKFLRGWTRREEEARTIALAIIAHTGAPVTTVRPVAGFTAKAPMVNTLLPAIAAPALAPVVFDGEGTWLVTIRRATAGAKT